MATAIRGKKASDTFILKPANRRGYGRNAALVAQRNEHLLYRFAYYRGDNRNSFDWMITQLAREFYLSESTVGQILQEGSDTLQRIRTERPSARSLKKKFPFFVW